MSVRGNAFYGAGTGHIWIDDLICGGNETAIDMCSFRTWGQSNCGHNEDLGVICRSKYFLLHTSINYMIGLLLFNKSFSF